MMDHSVASVKMASTPWLILIIILVWNVQEDMASGGYSL